MLCLIFLLYLQTNYFMIMIRIESAKATDAPQIAKLIMQAMNYECCQYFVGDHYTLDDFEHVMTALVERDDSQYSYLNTLLAVDDDSMVCGVCVSYDGARLHQLRQAFVHAMKACFDRDFSGMADETQAGELYIDSLAVDSRYRGQGIATLLLKATVQKAADMGLPAVGLLVDKGNPLAEKLYARVGFGYVDDNEWGGHPMRHLQMKC